MFNIFDIRVQVGIAIFLIISTPILIGIFVIARSPKHPFSQFAGLLTLKVFFTSPASILVLMILTNQEVSESHFLLVLPGIGLTLVLMILYRRLLFGEKLQRSAWRLMILDWLSWMLWTSMILTAKSTLGFILACFGIPLTIALPIIIAIEAIKLSAKARNEQTVLK